LTDALISNAHKGVTAIRTGWYYDDAFANMRVAMMFLSKLMEDTSKLFKLGIESEILALTNELAILIEIEEKKP
jgi:hypothetical protein